MVPVSVKAVIVDRGRVLLLANDRGEWELPGGRLDPGESETQALLREVAEELGVPARIGPRLADEGPFLACLPLPGNEIEKFGLLSADRLP